MLDRIVVRASWLVALSSVAVACAPSEPAPSTTPGSEPMAPASRELPPCPDDVDDILAELSADFEADLSAAGVTGGGLMIACGGEVVLAQGFGVTRDGGESVTPQTRFQLASATKMFTAAAAVALAEQGVLDLHAPVSTYLPFVGYGDVTLHELLTHTAGFATEFDAYDDALEPLVRANADMALWAEPGAVWNYSNPGFSVAGLAIEKATGLPFADAVAESLLIPSGLEATLRLDEVLAGSYAYGHSTDDWYGADPQPPDGAYYATGYYGPMGGLWGSVEDLGRWAQLHIEGESDALSHDSVELIQAPHARTTYTGSSYGYGMFVDTGVVPRSLRHSGSVVGFLTEFRVIPTAGFAVAAVVNSDAWFPEDVVYEAQERFVKTSYLPDGWTFGPGVWARYTGTYVDDAVLGTVRVEERSDGLTIIFEDDGEEAPLTWWSGDSFETTRAGEWLDVNFWRDSNNADASHIVSLYGVATRAP
jgi:CubicO group peptidase (beta-lactamase class C family)